MTPNELEAYDAMIADRDRWMERAERLESLYPSGAAPCSAVWLPAGQPPEGDSGRWSRKVVVLMMSGDALTLKYFRDDKTEEGRWQRPTGMQAGDMPLWWIDLPNAKVEGPAESATPQTEKGN